MKSIDVSLLEKDFKEISPLLSLIEQEDGISPSSLKTLYLLFNHSDLAVRQFVIIIALKKLEDENVNNAQLKQIEHLLIIGLGDKDTRCDALEGLSNFTDKNYIFLYGGMLLNDSNELVRVQAAENLSFTNNKEAIPFLEESLKDKSYLVKKYGAYGLGLLHSYKSINKLIELQKNNKNVLVKTACSGALLLLTNNHVWLDKLLLALSDKDYHVPMNAILYIEDAIEQGIISFDDVSAKVGKSLITQEHKPTFSRIEQFLKEGNDLK